jgi:hypothetical protein
MGMRMRYEESRGPEVYTYGSSKVKDQLAADRVVVEPEYSRLSAWYKTAVLAMTVPASGE